MDDTNNNNRLIPKALPGFWTAGFVHHHTAFGYPEQHRVSPGELQKEVADVGGDFVICAGDHDGAINGDICPGWYSGRDYYEKVLAANKDDQVILIPSGEYHLWFPELLPSDRESSFWRTKNKYPEYQPFHHTLIPMLEWSDDVCKHVLDNTSSKLVEEAERLDVPVTLNHPGLCYLTGHPDPLSIPWLKKMAYCEMFNTIDYFEYDWSIYKYYLGMKHSANMGIFAGVDFPSHKQYGFSTPENKRAENITYIHAPEGRSLESLYHAWQQRRTVAVRGQLYLKELSHVPSINAYYTDKTPEISFSIENFGNKIIHRIEILRNGKTCFRQYYRDKNIVDVCFSDTEFEDNASYTLFAEGEGDYLITSPIKFEFEVGR